MKSAEAAAVQPSLFPASGRRARPFLKWAGGKTRILPALLPHVPDRFARYHEPFLGGGAMLLAVRERAESGAFASDLNPELINAWHVVRSCPDALYEVLRSYEARDSESFYYQIRASRFTDPLERAAHFLYLNRTSWNGLYRVNRRGEFNVPWGAREFRAPSVESLHTVAAALHNVTITLADFREALSWAKRGDFVYLDPPYLRISDTSKFNGYTERRFRLEDLVALSERLKALTTGGVRWLLSNRDSKEMRELFVGHVIIPLTVRRAVAAQNRRSIEAPNSPEVIVSNANLMS